jgi:acetoacetyl-CoA synthetase
MSPGEGKDPGLLWIPQPGQIAQSNMKRFERFVSERTGREFADYEDLWRWSVEDVAVFWAVLWDFYGLDSVTDYSTVLDGAPMPHARWFEGARLNFAEFLLARGLAEDIAITGINESGMTSALTWSDLRGQVSSLAQTLRECGVEPGDRVVGYLPNVPEAVVAFLAAASVGAVWSAVGQDYAPKAVIDRFAQLSPKLLVTADGYVFNGHFRSRLDEIEAIRAGLDSVENTIVVSHRAATSRRGDWLAWQNAISNHATFSPAIVPFDHPLWVFSSGTTGRPKGLVQGHGGILVEQLKLHGLHHDLSRGDRLFWFTSPTWIMWNIQLSALAVGASIVCYDGAPAYPDASKLWQIVSEQAATMFGLSPGYLQRCESMGIEPTRQFDLSQLRSIGSTGAPLSSHLHQWGTDRIPGVPIFSTSGGTDVCTAFCGAVVTKPVWAGEISARQLGVAAEAWDDGGHSVVDTLGELVVTKPMPSMPLYFWNDPNGQQYSDAYFSTYPGVWRHGDWITITERGSAVIAGRSDSTLNRNGIRMGSAEIYAVVEAMPEIAEALVIGAELNDGYWMPLFVVLARGCHLDEALAQRIKTVVRESVSPRHVPDEIIQAPAIPHTRTGKKIEVPIKRLIQGAPRSGVVDADAVDDRDALDWFIRFAEARRTVGDP